MGDSGQGAREIHQENTQGSDVPVDSLTLIKLFDVGEH